MEKFKNWFHKPVFTLLCYVLAVILFGYTIFTINSSYDYINSLVLQGQVSWSTNIKEIVSYFVANSINYFVFAFAFICFGKVINILKPKPVKEEIESTEVTDETEKIEKIEETEALKEVKETNETEKSEEIKKDEKDKILEDYIEA